MHPQAVSDDQHPVQLHSEQPQKPPVVSPGLLSGDKLAVPAFQTATAGLRSEPCPAHGRAQLPRQLPVGRSLSGAKAKAQAGLLLGSVSTPVNGPCSVTGLQQLPQQLSQAVAPRPHVSRPQLVVGRPQQTLGPQLGQQQTTFVTSQNARSGVAQQQARPDAAGLRKIVAHEVGVGSARPASGHKELFCAVMNLWLLPQHAQQQPPQQPQQQPPQQSAVSCTNHRFHTTKNWHATGFGAAL
ncbi:TPA: hypothetical protein ACH3X2_000623 [Trebouxia sp. C0005]